MPNSFRWKPFVDGKRDCNECGEFKTVEGYYTRTDSSVSQTCRECISKKRRKDRSVVKGRRDDNENYIRQKECVICKETKDCSTGFRKKGGSRKPLYDTVCISCWEEQKTKNRENRRIVGPRHDDEPKYCNICKQTKTIKDFSYNQKHNFYSYCCKPCDIERKKFNKELFPEQHKEKRRKIYEKQKREKRHLVIMNSYKRIDISKGQQFGLTEEFVKQKLQETCFYCSFPMTGLDRKDNSKGHTDENCVACCTECNRARLDQFTHEEMKIIGLAIQQVKINRKNNEPG